MIDCHGDCYDDRRSYDYCGCITWYCDGGKSAHCKSQMSGGFSLSPVMPCYNVDTTGPTG